VISRCARIVAGPKEADVAERPFVDHYEVLQLSPRADLETLERVFRLLAKRYHPDNASTGDGDRFAMVREAYDVLSDPERRAAYDVVYDDVRTLQWKIYDQRSAADGREEDRRTLHAVLSLLYVERRRDPTSGGMGVLTLERLLGVPEEHLHFPLWYMKQHGWIEVLDTGHLAITVQGVDKLADDDLALPRDRLLPDGSESPPANGPRRLRSVDEAAEG
jgi:curved DNA-binding protein